MNRTLTFIALLVACLPLSCGDKKTEKEVVYRQAPQKKTVQPDAESKDQPNNGDQPTQGGSPEEAGPMPGYPQEGDPNQPPALAEGDFSGVIVLDESGACHIEDGNDTEAVSCSFGTNLESGEPQVTLSFPDFNLMQPPVCLFQVASRTGVDGLGEEAPYSVRVSAMSPESVSAVLEFGDQCRPCRPCRPCFDRCFDPCGPCRFCDPCYACDPCRFGPCWPQGDFGNGPALIGRVALFHCKVSG